MHRLWTTSQLEEIAKVDPHTGCWIWPRSCQGKGYGQTTHAGRMVLVHRLAAALFEGFDLASPLLVLHHCDNPPCFNPAHLFTGTSADNTADMMRKGRNGNGVRYLPCEKVAKARALVAAGQSLRAAARAAGISHTAAQVHCRDLLVGV